MVQGSAVLLATSYGTWLGSYPPNLDRQACVSLATRGLASLRHRSPRLIVADSTAVIVADSTAVIAVQVPCRRPGRLLELLNTLNGTEDLA